VGWSQPLLLPCWSQWRGRSEAEAPKSPTSRRAQFRPSCPGFSLAASFPPGNSPHAACRIPLLDFAQKTCLRSQRALCAEGSGND
jgi:hypothetical protein